MVLLDGSEVADSRPKSRRRWGLSPFRHGVARPTSTEQGEQIDLATWARELE